MKKILLLCFCSSLVWGAFGLAQAATFATQVCKGRACQPISFSPKHTVMDELNQLFTTNTSEILFCEADPATRTCLTEGLHFMGQSAHVVLQMEIPFARVVHVGSYESGLDVSLDYQVQANGYYPVCMVSQGRLALYNQGIMQLESNDFSCQLTQFGSTQMSVRFQLDYVDFAEKRLGAYYTIYSQGETAISGTGYALLRLSKNRHMIEQRSITFDPWKPGLQTPMMRTKDGTVMMTNVMSSEGQMMNKYDIRSHQSGWGISPSDSSANGLGGWYLNDGGAYVPMAAPDSTWRGKMYNWWEKLKKVIYLEPN